MPQKQDDNNTYEFYLGPFEQRRRIPAKFLIENHLSVVRKRNSEGKSSFFLVKRKVKADEFD